MKIKFVQKKNPLDQNQKKYYATPVRDGIIELEEIAEQISGRSTITYGDILGVLQNFIEFVPFLLMMGKSVRLGGLGLLRISFRSEGVDDPKDFHVSMIQSKRILLRAGQSFKNKIAGMKYETVK